MSDSRVPKHIAIIMDGNGRWAQRRGHARSFGHVRGATRAHEITRECAKLGVEALTLYTFSMENWQRPKAEVSFLWRLLIRELRKQRREVMDNNLRFRCLGFDKLLPDAVQAEINELTDISKKNTGMWLTLALSYGSRQEIVYATKEISRKVAAGELGIDTIDEQLISDHLFTAGLPEPDLLIRTGGDQRVSNYLLWQIAYTELFFLDIAWPDFTIEHLHTAMAQFTNRERRYGKVDPEKQKASL